MFKSKDEIIDWAKSARKEKGVVVVIKRSLYPTCSKSALIALWFVNVKNLTRH